MTRGVKPMASRGYCGVGIVNVKHKVNVGTLWRSAFCLGADFIFTVGDRFSRQASDTVKAYRHIPAWRFEDWADFHDHIPYDCQLIGVELSDKAVDLATFRHPERAIYLLGPEDGSLPNAILEECQHVVQMTSAYCLNVATAGSIVLYDRQAKSVPAEAVALGLSEQRGKVRPGEAA